MKNFDGKDKSCADVKECLNETSKDKRVDKTAELSTI